MRKVYRFLGYRQGRKRKGQEDCFSLPCRIAAWLRSSCLASPSVAVGTSALLYPQPSISIVSLFFGTSGLKFVFKMGAFSMSILIFTPYQLGSFSFLKWAHFPLQKTEMNMNDDYLSFENFLKMILSVLEKAGIDYMIGGAVAVWPWGEPRSTQDIDIVIQSLAYNRSMRSRKSWRK